MAGPSVKFSQNLTSSRNTPKLRDGQKRPFLHSIYMREWSEKREWEWVPQAVWSLAGLGWAFWITFRSSLERQVFDGGLRPVQLFVNTTITFPPSKSWNPLFISCFSWVEFRGFLLALLFVFYEFMGGLDTGFLFHLAPFRPSSSHTQKWIFAF